MWAPIIANFFQLICVIIGGFGTYQFRSKFVTVVSYVLIVNILHLDHETLTLPIYIFQQLT